MLATWKMSSGTRKGLDYRPHLPQDSGVRGGALMWLWADGAGVGEGTALWLDTAELKHYGAQRRKPKTYKCYQKTHTAGFNYTK